MGIQIRFNHLPGGPGNEAEFIELEDDQGRGMGTADGWYWVEDPDTDSVLLTDSPNGRKILN